MRIFVSILILVIAAGCGGDGVYLPKPRMYPKVDFPERSYYAFQEDFCNLTFELPDYARIRQDTLFFDEKPVDPCWFDIELPPFNGSIYCSYYPVTGLMSFESLLEDAFTFVEKHDIKANYREETVVENQLGASGMLFEIDGPVASPVQFFLTDSTRHFFRGSLYFKSKVNPDSMAVIHDFVKTDIRRMIETFQFLPKS